MTPKPHLFVHHKDKLLRSVMGHAIQFEKGKPVHVPKECWAEAQAMGAVPVEELPEEVIPQTNEPLDPAEREKMIFAAFETLVLKAERDDFSGTGMPHPAALMRELGFKVDAKERDKLWKKFTQLKGDGAE